MDKFKKRFGTAGGTVALNMQSEIQPKFRLRNIHALEWPSQSSDVNKIEKQASYLLQIMDFYYRFLVIK